MANAAPIRDSSRDAARRKQQRREQRRDRHYLAWLHTQPCLVCGSLQVAAHHEPPKSHVDWHDRDAVPLCHEHHNMGLLSRHLLGGLELFEKIHKLNLRAEIARLQRLYGDEQHESSGA